jgi:hypothetical protein
MKRFIYLVVYFVFVAPIAATAQAPQHDRVFAATMVAAHNAARAEVGAPPLVWNRALANQAQVWAETLMARRAFQHSSRSARHNAGENLAAVYGQAVGAPVLADLWTKEKAVYAYGPLHCDDSFEGIGHYTQIVWRGTRSVGCGLATRGENQMLVCRYAPAGNVCGERPY